MTLVRFDLGNDIDDLRREVNQIFAGMPALPALFGQRGRMMPAMDTFEKDGKLHVHVDLPGIREQDVDVEVQDDVLKIRGTREIDREHAGDTWYRHERTTGEFERYLQLPGAIDAEAVQASFDNGVLTVTVPLPAQLEAAPKKVAITSGNGKRP